MNASEPLSFLFSFFFCIICLCTQTMSLPDLKQWASGRMICYQIPTVLLVVDELPRNAMGKVNKKELITLYFGQV